MNPENIAALFLERMAEYQAAQDAPNFDPTSALFDLYEDLCIIQDAA